MLAALSLNSYIQFGAPKKETSSEGIHRAFWPVALDIYLILIRGLGRDLGCLKRIFGQEACLWVNANDVLHYSRILSPRPI